jgi:uncharacterized metal-binding protein YceD (DUF177 family)
MPLIVNLRHLEPDSLRLKGQLALEELDIDPHDEVIQLAQPLEYDLEVQMVEKALLVQGRLHLDLDCQCVRCLKPFQYRLDLARWACHLPLEGEEHVAVVNDCVDLTPQVREDILLEFPRHPVCGPECRGLPKLSSSGKPKNTSSAGKPEMNLPAWAELNKLKL